MPSNTSPPDVPDVIAKDVPAAIAHVRQHGRELRYEFVNEQYAALYGWKQEDVIGNEPRIVLGDDLFARAKPNMDRAIAGETVVFDLDFKGRRLNVTYAPDKEAPGFIGTIRDVTKDA